MLRNPAHMRRLKIHRLGFGQPSRPANLSLADLTIWPNWFKPWLATISVLSTQVRSKPSGLLWRVVTIHYREYIIWYIQSNMPISLSLLNKKHNIVLYRYRRFYISQSPCGWVGVGPAIALGGGYYSSFCWFPQKQNYRSRQSTC